MENELLAAVSQQMIERYSQRFDRLGYHVHTLGWGSKEQQLFRFKQTLFCERLISGKSVVDVGCGFGDYFAFLVAAGLHLNQYYGWDINPDLIREANKIWNDNPIASFEVKDISLKNCSSVKTAEVVVMLGVLNLNLQGKIDNYEYSFNIISNAFESAGEVLIVDFLSTHTIPDYPREDFVFYHDPRVMLDFALTLSPNVVLKHDYAPIPQKEFMLFIYK